MLAVRPDLMERLSPRLAAPEWAPKSTVAQQLEFGEANIAARVGFSVALGEHLAIGPEAVRARLAELGSISRSLLADVPGWALIEEAEEPSAITTLDPVDGADPQAVREWLLAERRILTTYIGVHARAAGADRAAAADLAARRHHRRRLGELRRSADRRDGRHRQRRSRASGRYG